MACPSLISPVCTLAGKAAELGGEAQRKVVDSGLSLISKQISEAIASVVRTTMTWWIKTPSVDLNSQPIIGHLREWFLPIAAAVTVAGLIAAGARMAAARKANPLIDVTGGLLVIAIVGAIGTLVPNVLLKAGDAWSTYVLNASTGNQFAKRMTDLLALSAASPAFVLIIGAIVLVLTVVQAVLMLLRETAIVILVGLLPLAAAGAMSPGMRGWIKRVAGWLLALIFYKPAAAAVYATAFTLIGTGHGVRQSLMGLCTLVLSLIALPVLIKFFTFATGSVGQQSGGGILGTAVGAMVTVGSLRASGGGGSAVAQADFASSRIPPPGGQPNGGAGDTTTSPGSPPSGGGDTPPSTTDAPDSPGGEPRTQQPTSPSGGTATATNSGTAQPGSTPANPAAASPASGTATGAAPTATGSAAGAAGATTSGATAAAAPVGAAASAGAAAGQKAADGARNAAGSAMTPDGSEQS